MSLIGTPGDIIWFGPKAVTIANQVHVFVATGDSRSARYGLNIKYATWNGKSWSNFTTLPDPPSKLEKGTVKFSNGFSFVRLPDNNRLQLVALTEEQFVARTTLEGTKWTSWDFVEDDEGDDGGFVDIPYVVSEGGDKLGYYAQRLSNYSIGYKQWDGSKFIPSGKAWLHIDIPGVHDGFQDGLLVSSAPDLASQHLWLVSYNYTLVHATIRGDKLSSVESLGDTSAVLPFVSHRDSSSIDITGFLYESGKAGIRAFDGKKWGEWQAVKSNRQGARYSDVPPAIGFLPPNNLHVLDVTFVSKAGIVANHKNNGTWYPKLDTEDDLFQYYTPAPSQATIFSHVRSMGQQVLKQWL
jgi:hypothetical protein